MLKFAAGVPSKSETLTVPLPLMALPLTTDAVAVNVFKEATTTLEALMLPVKEVLLALILMVSTPVMFDAFCVISPVIFKTSVPAVSLMVVAAEMVYVSLPLPPYKVPPAVLLVMLSFPPPNVTLLPLALAMVTFPEKFLPVLLRFNALVRFPVTLRLPVPLMVVKLVELSACAALSVVLVTVPNARVSIALSVLLLKSMLLPESERVSMPLVPINVDRLPACVVESVTLVELPKSRTSTPVKETPPVLKLYVSALANKIVSVPEASLMVSETISLAEVYLYTSLSAPPSR